MTSKITTLGMRKEFAGAAGSMGKEREWEGAGGKITSVLQCVVADLDCVPGACWQLKRLLDWERGLLSLASLSSSSCQMLQ